MLTLHVTSRYNLCIVWFIPAFSNSLLILVVTFPVVETFNLISGPIPDKILLPVKLPKS